MSAGSITPDETQDIDHPRLRHCTFVERGADRPLLMIVGQNFYDITEEFGDRRSFLNVKRYFDGRHHVDEISTITGVAVDDVRAMARAFSDINLLRRAEPLDLVPVDAFVTQIADSCAMWAQQIGYHELFTGLEQHTLRREVFVGLMLETYHYVRSARKHIAVAIAHCTDPVFERVLTEFFLEEHDHDLLYLETLERLGVDRQWVVDAHPIIGSLSLQNMMCEIGRQDTLAYIACTSLIEARAEDAEGATESLTRICTGYGDSADAVEPALRHMLMDVEAGHTSLLGEALEGREFIPAAQAHHAVNALHDLKHSFDQLHDQVIQYYTDISNYIPRLKVDYFSL
jgi:hypothetical protein